MRQSERWLLAVRPGANSQRLKNTNRNNFTIDNV